MTQNIYDDPGFFAAYGRLERSLTGLDGAPEWPALQALLPDVNGARVLDLGCGFGWFSRWARTHGAASVLGIDVSERMLARAAADTHDPAIRYMRSDLETVVLPHASFELAYSSLALHYLVDLNRLLAQVHTALVAGGHFIASVEHPIYTAPSVPRWSVDPAGRRVWPIDRYSVEGSRTTDWLAPGVVKQHRTTATYVNLLLDAGFRLTRLVEWAPTDPQVAARAELLDERARPMFLLFAAVRV